MDAEAQERLADMLAAARREARHSNRRLSVSPSATSTPPSRFWSENAPSISASRHTPVNT